jgi:hypothetical protein
MIRINVKADIKAATAKLNSVQRRQVPFATSKALNDTAWEVVKEEQRQMPAKLDRPTLFSIRAFGVDRSTKSKLFATVFVKPIQAAYLIFQIFGGRQKPKKRALVLPVNQRRNRYGNLPKGKIKALLADPRNFSGKVRGVGGIWRREKNGRVRLLVAWRPEANYRPDRFPFHKIGIGKARAVFARNFRRALDIALRSAR